MLEIFGFFLVVAVLSVVLAIPETRHTFGKIMKFCLYGSAIAFSLVLVWTIMVIYSPPHH